MDCENKLEQSEKQIVFDKSSPWVSIGFSLIPVTWQLSNILFDPYQFTWGGTSLEVSHSIHHPSATKHFHNEQRPGLISTVTIYNEEVNLRK